MARVATWRGHSPTRWGWLVMEAPNPNRVSETTTVELLVEEARAGLTRLGPHEAREAQRRGALLVDIRSEAQQRRDGLLPGSVIVQRNVLEWRLDPSCPDRDRALATRD